MVAVQCTVVHCVGQTLVLSLMALSPASRPHQGGSTLLL